MIIAVDRFLTEIQGEHICSSEWIFPLVETNENFEPVKILQTCFSIINAPILITAAHYTDLFSYLKPSVEDGLIHLPNQIRNLIPYTSVLRFNNERTQMGIYPVAQAITAWNHDMALLLVNGGFDKTPKIPISNNARIGLQVSSFGYPTHNNQEENLAKGIIKTPLVAIADGRINDLHEEPRGGLWYPSIEVDYGISGGMSGGPMVTKQNNEIVGINSRSWGLDIGFTQATWFEKAINLSYSFNAKIVYEDFTEFDLMEFTLKELIDFTSDKDGLCHTLLPSDKNRKVIKSSDKELP